MARTKIQMQGRQMGMKLPLKHDTRYARQFAEVYSEGSEHAPSFVKL